MKESIIVRYWKYLSTRKEHRRTIKILNRLSDRELKDIGLTRGDINYMIFREKDIRKNPEISRHEK